MRWGLLKRLFARREPRSRVNETFSVNRTIMVVSPLRGEYDTLRVLSILEGWRLLIAPTLETALALRRQERIAVILYDQDLAGVGWLAGIVSLLNGFQPTCLILLSFVVTERLRLSVLAYGGCDLARKPLDRTALVPLVNGCLALVNDIDSRAVQNAVLQ